MKRLYTILLTLVLTFALTVPAFAATTANETCTNVGEVPLVVYNAAEASQYRSLKNHFFIIRGDTSGAYYVCYANSPACLSSGDGYYVGGNYTNFLEDCYHLKLSEAGTVLEDKGLQNYMDGWYLGYDTTPVFSTCEVKWSHTNGKTFFMKSPSLVQLTGMAVGELTQTVVGQMGLLATCGVGCLALLTALPLLARKLRIFLP